MVNKRNSVKNLRMFENFLVEGAKEYTYVVKKDDGGGFLAEILDGKDVVFTIDGDGFLSDGYADDKDDVDGVKAFLVAHDVMKEDDVLTKGGNE